MSDRTILVTGATGLLGRQVAKAFAHRNWTVKGTGWSRADGLSVLKVDLSNGADIEKVLDQTKPQAVVHCAANRFPDKVDLDPIGTRALNIDASLLLARLCATRNILFLYISSDYVFPGRPGDAPYAAVAPTAPPNLYGRTKLDGERVVLDAYAATGKPGRAVVLRVPLLYGPAETPAESSVNVLMDTLWESQKRRVGEVDTGKGKIKMDHWAIRYPTNTEDVGRVCVDLIAHYLGASDPASLPRVVQFSSEDKYTKYEMCQVFGDIMGLPVDGLEPNTVGNDPGVSVQRPYDCHLSTAELKALGIDLSTVNFVDWWRREVGAFRK